ncbi:MAG: ArnT family glycosyltransferase [Dissulfurispiraceae bacterium]
MTTRFLLPILTVAIFMSCFRLGAARLFDVDEAVFSEATREMVENGQWITPTYNGVNRYDKPILFYWIMALSYKAFGVNEFSARFPSAIAAILLSLSLFHFVSRHVDEETAFYAALPLVLSPYFLGYSRAAVTDMTLTLFITLSLFSLYLWAEPPKETPPGADALPDRRRWFLYGFYLFSALAFLTKGLVGILFPFGIALVYLLATEGLSGVKKIVNFPGTMLFLIVSAPWYGAQVFINGWEFIQQFIIKHHFVRYTEVISGHNGPVFYYIPALIVGLFPWIAFLPGGVVNTFKRRHGVNLFAFIWLIFIVAFFSFSTTKLPNYILPAIPAAAILISSGMTLKGRWIKHTHLFIAFTALLMGIAFGLSRKYLTQLGIDDSQWIYVVIAVMGMVTVLSLYCAIREKTCYGFLSGLFILFLSILLIKALPIANQYLQGTLHKYSVYAKDNLGGNEDLITYRINNPSILFYSNHRILSASDKDGLILFLKERRRFMAITKTKDSGDLEGLGFKMLSDDGTYALLERK